MVPGSPSAGCDVGHRDRHAERGRLGAAGHDAGPPLGDMDRVAVPGDPAALDDQADEALARTLGRHPLERGPADEVSPACRA